MTKMSLEENIGVVIDIGSQTTKAGFAGESFPRCIIESAVGRFRCEGISSAMPSLIYCGKEAIRKRGVSRLTFPIENGHIKDWDEMEKFWYHIFYKELLVPPEQANVLHNCHSLATMAEKERMAEILFESFTIRGLYIAKSPVLVLAASGISTGVVWDNGYSCSTVTPVFEGFPLKHSTLTSEFTGEALTDRLQKLLMSTGYSFTTPVERNLLNEMKAKQCYVSQDYTTEADSIETKVQFNLPDGQHVLLGKERFQCPEALFQPSLDGRNCLNIPDLICSSINKCDLDYKPLFYNNIVLCGGSTMFRGLTNRLHAELKHKVREPGVTVEVKGINNRLYSSWVGGSILASIDTLKGFWLSSKEYDDEGSSRVSHKFF